MGLIKIIASGIIKDQKFSPLIQEYTKRINKYHKLEVHEIKEKKYAEEDTHKYFNEFGDQINKHLDPRDYTVIFDNRGREVSSEDFAFYLNDILARSVSPAFIIGGSIGLPPNIEKKAKGHISFGRITFPHKLFRVVLLEQIYRAMTIVKGEPYHK